MMEQRVCIFSGGCAVVTHLNHPPAISTLCPQALKSACSVPRITSNKKLKRANVQAASHSVQGLRKCFQSKSMKLSLISFGATGR